jgi:predicted amidohydrolase
VFVVLSTLVTTARKRDENSLAEPSWVHVGGSFVMNPYGQMIAKVEPFIEGVALANIELSQIGQSRLYWNQFGKDVPNFDL